MRRLVFTAAFVVVSACQGDSEFQVQEPTKPIVPGPTDVIPTGESFLPLLSGHRVATNGTIAVASDPEGVRADGKAPVVFTVDLASRAVKSVALPDGARPGAIELDGSTAWVVLEGSRGIVSIDTVSAQVKQYYAVCAAPVDLALSGSDVWVACLSGEVARISGGKVDVVKVSGVPTRVASAGTKVFVALSNAAVVEVGLDGVHRTMVPGGGLFTLKPMTANTPRRLLPRSDGSVAMLHQQSVMGEVLGGSNGDPLTGGMREADGGTGGSAYSGGGGICPQPAAMGAVSTMGITVGPTATLSTTLAIDFAASPQNQQVAVADPAAGSVLFVTQGQAVLDCGSRMSDSVPMPGVTSVAYTPDGKLVALNAGTTLSVTVLDAARQQTTVSLRARSVPPGFTLFHASPAQKTDGLTPNVSCATCHPAGLNNGATLTVNGVKHKVMTIGGHLEMGANVHWDHKSFQTAVIDGTWRTNMGGRELLAAEAQSMQEVIAQLKLPPAPSIDAQQLADGRAAFSKAGCAGCHDPARHWSNDAMADVGRGSHKVPSLAGLAYSAPYMSDGCARTLEERFDNAACGGGAQHGNAAGLTVAEKDALLAFLRAL